MSWVRIHDGAMTHPKVVGLIDWKNPFCLWVWGLSYCQQHLTDGAIPYEAFPNAAARKTATKLVLRGLWDATYAGYVVHDYLQWNDAKATVLKKRESLRERVTRYRRDYTSRARNASATSGVSEGTDGSTIQNAEGVQGEPTGDQPEHGDRRIALRRSGDFGRIFLHRWQLDNLIATLGEHVDAFGLDEWLDALNTRIAGKALPPDPWKFVKSELHAEIARRGLAVAAETAAAPTNKRIAGLVAGGEAFLRREAEKRARGLS